MCSYGQLSKVQMLRDLDLGSGQGHITIHSTSRTTSMPNHVTVASRTTETWPFEFREISTFGEVWTLVMAFLEGNSKIGLQQAVVQVPYYHHFWAPCQIGRRDRSRKCNFHNFGSSVTLTLTLDRVKSHWCAYVVEVYPHTKLDGNWKNFLWLYVRTDVRMDTPEFQLPSY